MTYKGFLQKEVDDFMISAEICSGAFVRFRNVCIEKGGKCSYYFLNLERKQQTINTINKINDKNKIEQSDNK